MSLDIRQKNNLLAGVKLAAELEPSAPTLRKFITVQGYKYNSDGRKIDLSNFLNADNPEDVFYEVYCYEISVDYYTNNWDVSDNDLKNRKRLTDICGVIALEGVLKKYLSDFSILQPEWHCENLI